MLFFVTYFFWVKRGCILAAWRNRQTMFGLEYCLKKATILGPHIRLSVSFRSSDRMRISRVVYFLALTDLVPSTMGEFGLIYERNFAFKAGVGMMQLSSFPQSWYLLLAIWR